MIYVYGAGNLGRIVGSRLLSAKTPFAFIDRYTSLSSLLGVTVYRPEQITITSQDQVYNTVAAMPLKPDSQTKLLEQIAELGFQSILDFDKLEPLFPGIWSDFISDRQFWRQKGVDLANPIWNLNECNNFRSWLSDARSIELFDNIQRFRENPCQNNYIRPDIGTQYIETDIKGFPSYDSLHVADLGAFDGDTLRDFILCYTNRIKSYHAFEPDPENFQKLVALKSQYAAKLSQDSKILCHQFATGDCNKKIRFSATQDSTSTIVLSGGIEVEQVYLDNYLSNTEINYLKLDIEGAELPALTGAKQIIAEQKPDIAVALYHHPSDLWQIPKLIRSLMPDAKMYLRQHHHWGLELTLYCCH